FSTLRVVVHGEHVQEMPAVSLQLTQQPWKIIRAPMIGAIRQKTPTMLAAVLLIVAAVEVATPAPLFGPHNLCVGIRRPDLRGVIENSIPDFVHRGARWMHVAMRRMPDTLLILQYVITRCGA